MDMVATCSNISQTRGPQRPGYHGHLHPLVVWNNAAAAWCLSHSCVIIQTYEVVQSLRLPQKWQVKQTNARPVCSKLPDQVCQLSFVGRHCCGNGWIDTVWASTPSLQNVWHSSLVPNALMVGVGPCFHHQNIVVFLHGKRMEGCP